MGTVFTQASERITERFSVFEMQLTITVLTLIVLGIVLFYFAPKIGAKYENWFEENRENIRVVEYLDIDLDDPPYPLTRTCHEQIFRWVTIIITTIFLIWTWGYWHEFRIAVDYLSLVIPHLTRVVITFFIAVLTYGSSKWVNTWLHEQAEEYGRVDQHQIEIAARTAQITLIISAVIAVLGVWQVDIGNLLLGAGVIGIIVGLAVRQTLSAALSGFLMMFSRPFEIGDWVEIGGNRGTVIEITILNTRLRNSDGERVIIPNDSVASQTIINRSRQNRLRVRSEVGVAYGTDLDRACEIINEVVSEMDEVCNAPAPEVIPKDFDDSAVTIEARYWIRNPNAQLYDKVRAEVVNNIHIRFEEEGITIPFPQRTLHGKVEMSDGSSDDQ